MLQREIGKDSDTWYEMNRRLIYREKIKDLSEQFPIGSYIATEIYSMRWKNRPIDQIAKVTGYTTENNFVFGSDLVLRVSFEGNEYCVYPRVSKRI